MYCCCQLAAVLAMAPTATGMVVNQPWHFTCRRLHHHLLLLPPPHHCRPLQTHKPLLPSRRLRRRTIENDRIETIPRLAGQTHVKQLTNPSSFNEVPLLHNGLSGNAPRQPQARIAPLLLNHTLELIGNGIVILLIRIPCQSFTRNGLCLQQASCTIQGTATS